VGWWPRGGWRGTALSLPGRVVAREDDEAAGRQNGRPTSTLSLINAVCCTALFFAGRRDFFLIFASQIVGFRSPAGR